MIEKGAEINHVRIFEDFLILFVCCIEGKRESLRETENPKFDHSGVAWSRLRRVDLPVPDGPNITMGVEAVVVVRVIMWRWE